MTLSEMSKRFVTTIVAVFGGIAAAVGVAALGWSCAVGYYGLRSDLAHLNPSAAGDLTEQQWRAMNDTLLMSLGALSENVMDTKRSADEMSSSLTTKLIACQAILYQSHLGFTAEQDGHSYFILAKYPSKWINLKTGLIEMSRFRSTPAQAPTTKHNP